MGSTPAKPVVVEAHGHARSNPGKAACAAIVGDHDTGRVLSFDAQACGYCTGDVAAYHAVLLGLDLAQKHPRVELRLDNWTVVRQLLGERDSPFTHMMDRVAEAVAGRSEVTFVGVQRFKNRQAQKLALAVLDGADLPRPDALDVSPEDGSRPKSRVGRIEQTAALAARHGLAAEQAGTLAERLAERDPEGLADIWGQTPGARWLARVIAQSPISWGRGLRRAGAAAT